ncbi:hypothetical protein EGH22_19135 [Halomicroarcula sp. F28]|uniref:hypothetical protein n=1 Tax=Haloarcula salinisoli TaxID=2487746 RepID=UPI001C732EDB|nr:hypothetical protein [Halomicroarcula salinisoli]MBX0288450.1 hypothetical protein [Halomicroarcula salinisoli]
MSTETSPADGEHREATKSESTSPDFPTLTVTAEGVAERRQQVGTSMSCIETTPVQLSFTTTLGSESEWEGLVNPTFRTHYPTIERGAFVDRLLGDLDSAAVYERQSSCPTEAPKWDLAIEAPAPEWKRLMMAFLVRDDRDDEDRAYQAVSNLQQLLTSRFANAGVALAALDLVDEYDLDHSTETFHKYIRDNLEGSEDG